MTEKLDSYRPSLEMTQGIRHQLQRAGINSDDIPMQWDEAIIAATIKWFLTTQDGLEYFSRLFCCEGKKGEDDKEYAISDNVNNRLISIKNSDVWLFEGALVGGRPMPLMDPHRKGVIPPLELEISETYKNKCDGCGIVSHCLKYLMDPYTEESSHLCNYCVTFHEHPKVNDCGGLRYCEECTVQGCKHHPERKRA